ncbi:transporter substrate-binding domain-containing protein [Marinobacter sp. SS13-12]|uniref:substrate-binding periplasmic protein n=1 Tax=Marinobacter sp. SS13-12 TaxID=3050451 RepID=UPI00255275CD|nr:transporter substrate-binding domain-containing protein [Marinobacter sp. SS13-12]MDK8465678.1 transporter substrate-binding domain-containing protein [Marinobacter sp. SS13-12]
MAPRSILAFLCVLLAGGSLAEERTITLVGDKWCPFNCNDHPDHRGVLVEKAASALAEEGFKLEYIEIPWSRAIISVRDGQYDAIVGTGISETPDFHFPPEPLANAHHSFFTLPTSAWEYQGLESLKDIRIGVIQDYSYGGLYEDYIKENQDNESRVVILRGDRVLPRLVEMLGLGRIDVLVAEERVLNYHFALSGQENPLRHAGLANEEALYVAFSPALDDGAEFAEALGHGMKKIEKSP